MTPVEASLRILRDVVGNQPALVQHLDVISEEIERLQVIEQRLRIALAHRGDDALSESAARILGDSS